MTFNIRLGTTWAKERERVLKLARKYSLSQRLIQERLSILYDGVTSEWTDNEQQYIVSASQNKNNWSSKSTIPFRIDHYHSPSTCVELIEDPSNVIIRSKKRT